MDLVLRFTLPEALPLKTNYMAHIIVITESNKVNFRKFKKKGEGAKAHVVFMG